MRRLFFFLILTGLVLLLGGCVATPPPPPATSVPPTLVPTPTLGLGSTRVYTDGMTGRYVPAGDFLMGSTDADIVQAMKDCAGCNFEDEKPQHTVTLDAYWIDQTEVTNAMFTKFVGATGYKTGAEEAGAGWVFDLASAKWAKVDGADWQHPTGPGSTISSQQDYPVVQMGWNDATAYCLWAGRHLPTEAQWEKAARGTDGRIFPWGNQPLAGNLLNFADKNLKVEPQADKTADDGYQFAAPVGHYPAGASPYGALDMAGNVWEWVADNFAADYYQHSPAQNPTGPAAGQDTSLMERGGSWDLDFRGIRSAFRWGGAKLTDWAVDIGFRCASAP